jgi:hypothetical protein
MRLWAVCFPAFGFDADVHRAIAKMIEFAFSSKEQQEHEAFLLGLRPYEAAGYFHEVLEKDTPALTADTFGLSTECGKGKAPAGLQDESLEPGNGNLPARIKAWFKKMKESPLQFDERHVAARTLISLMADLHQPFHVFTATASKELRNKVAGSDAFDFMEKWGYKNMLHDMYESASDAWWHGNLYPLQFNALFGITLDSTKNFDVFINKVVHEQYQHVCNGILSSDTDRDGALNVLDTNLKLAAIRSAYVLEALHAHPEKKHIKNLLPHPDKKTLKSRTKAPHHRIDANWRMNLVTNFVITVLYVPLLLVGLTKLPDVLELLPHWAKKAI